MNVLDFHKMTNFLAESPNVSRISTDTLGGIESNS